MKKKIIDLTLEERIKICDSHIRCTECPLRYSMHYLYDLVPTDTCYSNHPHAVKYPKRFLKKKVII